MTKEQYIVNTNRYKQKTGVSSIQNWQEVLIANFGDVINSQQTVAQEICELMALARDIDHIYR